MGDGVEAGRTSGDAPLIDEGGESKAVGVVTGDGAENYGTNPTGKKSLSGGEAHDGIRNSITGEGGHGGAAWKLNVVLILLTFWYPMVLTDWGAMKNEGHIAKPQAGETALWMQMVAQWVALT